MTLRSLIVVLLVIAGRLSSQTQIDSFQGHPRLIVISDIGNEPDGQMSFVRLLLYSSEIDIEGLVASTSTWHKERSSPSSTPGWM